MKKQKQHKQVNIIKWNNGNANALKSGFLIHITNDTNEVGQTLFSYAHSLNQVKTNIDWLISEGAHAHNGVLVVSHVWIDQKAKGELANVGIIASSDLLESAWVR